MVTSKPAIKSRPWQYTLRFLLGLTTLVAIIVAPLAWRARQVQTQHRAVEKIKELGGTVEFEPWGPVWLSRVIGGEFFRNVVRVELPGHRADEAWPVLRECPSLKRATLTYSVTGGIAGGFSFTIWRHFEIDGKLVDPPSEKERCQRFIDKLPGVAVEITASSKPIPFDEAFIGTQTFPGR